MKKVKILIVILIISIIMIALSIVILLPKLKEEEILEFESQVLNEDILDIQEEISYKAYSIIEKCIENYIKYSNEVDKEKLASILEKAETIENFGDIYYLKINKIYKIERLNDTTYFVESVLDDKNLYFVVNIDYITKSYNIRRTNQGEFENAKENKVDKEYLQSIEIKSNSYNKIEDKDLSDEQIVNKYYYNYTKLAINKPEIAFNILDKNYKSKKFNNDINMYKEYIQNNKKNISDSTILDINVNSEENYKKYTITDNYGDTYILTEYNYTDYTIYKEEISKDSKEYIDEYLSLSGEERVKKNIQNVFKLLDNKEYESVYNLLNTSFKNSNFPTLEDFKNYAKEEFFDYNMLGNITIEEQGKNYVINVNYKDGVSSAAEKRKKNFVMRLLEETNFEISFEID